MMGPRSRRRSWVKAMGRPELLQDPRFSRHSARLEHRQEVRDVILDWARGFDSFDDLHDCVDPQRIAVRIVRSVRDLAATDWATERELVTEVSPGMLLPRLPYRSPDVDLGAKGRGPRRGEHNREVFGRLAGVDSARLDAMEARGALRAAEDGAS